MGGKGWEWGDIIWAAWGWNIGGSTWIESICIAGIDAAAGGGHGGGFTNEAFEDDIIIGESDWQERVGELGEGGGGTENCWGLYGIVGPFGGDSAMMLHML